MSVGSKGAHDCKLCALVCTNDKNGVMIYLTEQELTQMNEKIGQALMVGLPVLAVGALIFFGWPRHEIMKVQATEWAKV